MEQQYTCPFCWKDYTRFTIHEHYGCGVEPLETAEVETHHNLDGLQGGSSYEWGRVELGAISEKEEVAEQESLPDEQKADVVPTETIPPVEQPKAEPKKRGRKLKAK